MGADQLRRDPIGAILENEEDTAKIVTDVQYGYDRIIPKAQYLSDMETLFAEEIVQADDDYKAAYEQLDRDEAAYEASNAEGDLPKLPTVKRIINQQHAWTSTAILTKNPIVTVKPLDGGSYTIPAQILSSSQGTEMGSTYDTEELSTTDAASLYEQYLQFKFTEKLDFEQLVDDTIMSIHIGEKPTWWKIYYDPKVRIAKQRQFIDIGPRKKKFVGVVDVRMKDGEAVCIDHVSFRNIVMPLYAPGDEQSKPWLAERMPMTNTELWERFQNGEFDCANETPPTIDEIREMLGLGEDLYQQDATFEMKSRAIDKRVSSRPGDEHDVRMLWFFWPLRVTREATSQTQTPVPTDNEQTETTPDSEGAETQTPAPKPVASTSTIEIRSLCGYFHVTAQRFLNLYSNPNWNMKRPYVPFFQRKKPHRFTGWSSAGDLAPLAELSTAIYHLQINNGVQQNVKIVFVRNNSISHITLKRAGNQLKPGMILPFDDPKDIALNPLGAPIESMHAEIDFLNTEAERLGVVNDYDLGAEVPNRTAGVTLGQVQQMAKMQPQTILRSIRRSISKAVEMYLSMVCQYNQFEDVPYLDERTNKLIRLLISFPQETVENHFAFHVTATGDEDTTQGRIEKLQLLLDATDKANEAAMKLGDIAIDPATPPPAAEFALMQLLRREALYKELVSTLGPQYSKYAFTESKIKTLQQQAQQYAQQKAQEAANQPPEPPHADVSVSLKGELPPDQEAQLASKVLGIQVQPQAPPQGAMNGEGNQLPPPAPGGAVPQLQPTTPGPGDVPQQPPDQGMAQPDALGNPQQGTPPA